MLNKFYLQVLMRIILIILTCILFGIAFQKAQHGYYYTISGLLLLIFYQAYLLINLVNKTNTDLEKFLASLQDQDSSVKFPAHPSDSGFAELHQRLDHLTGLMQNAKIENERSRHLLQNIIDHIDIGLISYNIDGTIGLCNKMANRYLNMYPGETLKNLKSRNEEIFSLISDIKPGEELLCKITRDNVYSSLLVKAMQIRSEDNLIKLVSFDDITNELNKKELDSWHKIIRILTHEIMNSISPITSLTSIISGYFKGSDASDKVIVDQQLITKTLNGLNTIEETGKGLLGFLDKYRKLTTLPKPVLSSFKIETLFSGCKILMESCLDKRIHIYTQVIPCELRLIADYGQVEQILINLIKNSMEALSEVKEGNISLKAYPSGNTIILQVEDNGAGISPEIIENIFIPFYTTRDNGSGIGLSLSRQIMQNHHGSITVSSTPGTTIFTLEFPA